MADPIYNIWIRDLNIDGANPLNTSLQKVALVTRYTKLEFSIRYNDVGGWTLTMPGDTEEANRLKAILIGTPSPPINNLLQTGNGFGGIVVTRNGDIVFSGPVRGFNETGDYTGPDGKTIEFNGICDTGYLRSRIPMSPAPATNGRPVATNTLVPLIPGSTQRYFVAPYFQNWAYWVYGSGDTTTTEVMRNLVRTNISDAAPFGIGNGYQDRRIPFFDVPDQVEFGPNNFRSRSRYAGTLLDKVQEAATYQANGTFADDIYPRPYRGASFRVYQTIANRLEFIYWDPRDPDHNKGTVFSAGRGNLGAYKYSHQAPNVTFSVVGGQADDNAGSRNGTSRWFEHKGGSSPTNGQTISNITRYGLWEGYIDRRDVQYQPPINNNPVNANYTAMSEELINAMDVHLREEGEQIHLEVTALNTPSTSWPRDYNVGDIVTVVIDNYRYQEIVRDVTVTLTRDEGEVVRPTIGTEATGMSVRLFEKLNDIDSSINNLNSSQ